MKRLRLYLKLSWKNFSSYKRLYRPLILASGTLLMMFLLLNSIKDIFMIDERMIGTFVNFGSVIIALFSFIFIAFARRFILRQRGKEMGLYTALGLGKKEFTAIYFFELLYSLFFSLLLGIILSVILGPLFTLAFQRLIEQPLEFVWQISLSRLLFASALFALIFIFSFIPEIITITRLQPKDIFESGKESSARVRANPFTALAAFFLIGTAYYLALSIKDPAKSSFVFFFAIIMVIIGTYCFYHSLLIVLLKFLQRRKSFYYKPQHFIKLSSMLFRLKAHASGLANITILACMILVTLTVTLNFFVSIPPKAQGEVFDNKFAFYFNRVLADHKLPPEETAKVLLDLSAEQEKLALKIEPQIEADIEAQMKHSLSLDKSEQKIELKPLVTLSSYLGGDYGGNLQLASLEAGERIFGQKFEEQRAYLYSTEEDSDIQLQNLEKELDLKIILINDGQQSRNKLNELRNENYLFASREVRASLLMRPEAQELGSNLIISFLLDKDLSLEKLYVLTNSYQLFDPYQKILLPQIMSQKEGSYSYYGFDSKELERSEFLRFFTLFMFIGVLCGLTFLVGMSVISWFKQFSEAEVERRRIAIMEQIGLSQKVIRKSAKSQIYWLLILPLFVAIVHCSFALPYIHKGFTFLSGGDPDGIFIRNLYFSSAVSFGALLFLYYIIYSLSSSAYWKTLQMRNRYDLKGANREY